MTTLYKILLSLWRHVDKKRKKQFKLLLFVQVVASVFEVISLGAVLPFLGALTAPEKLFYNKEFQPFIYYVQIDTPSGLLFPLTLIFCALAIFSIGDRGCKI
jgi:hypothetical protein